MLCLALAGAVGLSPYLHQLIEHGGHGALHTHPGNDDLVFESSTKLSSIRTTALEQSHPKRTLNRNHRPFRLPVNHLATMVKALGELINGPASETPHGPDHEHHSLSQLLASGLLDQHIDFPVLPHFVPSGSYTFLSPDELLLASIWNAQTPDRGPPSA